MLKDKGDLTDKVSNQAESLRITMLEEEKKGKRIEELEKENAEQLEQVKTFLKELINIINYLNEDEYEKEDFPIVHKAEQFLKEIEK